jgi:D-lyxose ketol-isomerase
MVSGAMITLLEKRSAQRKALAYFAKAGIVVSASEKKRIEVADFGLSELKISGLEILTYVNTQRCCAKELVLLPKQTCPEHLHPNRLGRPGKEETFRCRWGLVYLYVAGQPIKKTSRHPKSPKGAYSVGKEVILKSGDQYTVPPGTKHWFQAGPKGAVVSEFSTRSHDASDRFTDKRVRRGTVVKK